MARRRRKGNPLLVKIVVVSVAAHAIALPILAHFGAFDKIKREFGTSRVVMVTLPPVPPEKPHVAPKAEKKTKTAAAKKPGGAPKASAAQKAGLPQPKVVASTGPADGAGGGATVDADATGKAGVLPSGVGGSPTPAPKPPETPPAPPETKPETPVQPPPKLPETKPEPPPAEPKKPDPPAPKPRRIVQAETLEAPTPTIPDELRAEPFEKTLVVEADVDAGGRPTNVRVAQTTGVKALDDSGLDAARRYRFKPATIDDEPVEQHVRFRIVFKVE